MAYLVLVRHGESEFNKQNKWAGTTKDVALTKRGREEARRVAKSISNIYFHQAFTSNLVRAQETLEIINETLGQKSLPVATDSALNERDYGEFTGRNKTHVKNELPQKDYFNIWRGWNHPAPRGESLKEVHDRTIPFYDKSVRPLLKAGKNVLIVTHANNLRALVKYLDKISDDKIHQTEIKTGEVHIYEMNDKGRILNKVIRS